MALMAAQRLLLGMERRPPDCRVFVARLFAVFDRPRQSIEMFKLLISPPHLTVSLATHSPIASGEAASGTSAPSLRKRAFISGVCTSAFSSLDSRLIMSFGVPLG